MSNSNEIPLVLCHHTNHELNLKSKSMKDITYDLMHYTQH